VEDPERILTLNVRAMTQLLRNNEIEVRKTSHEDMELEDGNAKETMHDAKILAKEGVKGWCWVSTDVDEEDTKEAKGQVEDSERTEPSEAVVGNELLKQREGTTAKLASQGKI
jgi:platelet-activating factor acetylhydrolase